MENLFDKTRETWIADRAEFLATIPTITPATARALAELDYEEMSR